MPTGYKILKKKKRNKRKGGGVALVINKHLMQKKSKLMRSELNFRYFLQHSQKNKYFHIAVVHRPPPKTRFGLTASKFFDEINKF